MEFAVLQENLATSLALAKPLASAKNGPAILKCFRLFTEDGLLKVEATNLAERAVMSVGSMVAEEGSVCVDAARFTDLVSTLPSDRVDIKVEDAANPVLEINGARSDLTLLGQDAVYFPEFPEFGEMDVVSIDADLLQSSIRRVSVTVAKNDHREVLSGVLLELGPSGFKMASADGFRLTVQKGRLIDTPIETFQVIIPAATLTQVSRMLKSVESVVYIQVSKDRKFVRFRMLGSGHSAREVSSRLITGDYPDFEAHIPQKWDWSFQIERDSLLGAVRSAAVYSVGVDSTDLTRLWMDVDDVSPGDSSPEEGDNGEDKAAPSEDGEEKVSEPPRVWVSAKAPTVGDAKRHALCLEANGLDSKDSGRIAFKTSYLMEFLRSIEGKVVVCCQTPSNPGLFQLVGDEDYVHVVMPMFVQW